MKRNSLIIIFALGMIALSFVAVFWMDRNSYRETASVQIDPAAVGASLISKELYRGEGPVVIGEIEMTQNNAQKIPNPVFWMVVGAVCACFGVFIATRERAPRLRLPRKSKIR